jgi:hypothetical protein
VLVSIGSLLSSLVDKFPDGVDTDALMRIDISALSVYDSLRQILRVNATREQL